MIELLVAERIEPGSMVLLPWPDWGWRRFVVHDAYVAHGLVTMDVQAADGEDAGLMQHVARLPVEPMHIVVKAADNADEPCMFPGCNEPRMPRAANNRGGAAPAFCSKAHKDQWRYAQQRRREAQAAEDS